MAVAVVLALAGAGCDGGGAGTTSVPVVSSTAPPTTETTAATTTTSTTVVSSTVPSLVAAGVLLPVVAPGEVPYEPPGFVWGGEAAPLGLLSEAIYGWAWYPRAVFFSQPPSLSPECRIICPDQSDDESDVRYAIVSGVYLGAEERQVWWPVGAETDPPVSYSVIALVFDFGTPPGGVDPVVGRFYIADAAGPDPSRSVWFGDVSWTPVLDFPPMNRRWLDDDPEIPPLLPNEYGVLYGGTLTYEELIDKSDPPLVVGRQYALELPIEGHPSVSCCYEICYEICCGEEVTDPGCRDMTTPVKDMGFFEAENRAIVSAMKGDAPLGDSTVGLVSLLHDPFPGRYDEPAVICFACGFGYAEPADTFPPFEDFPRPPTFFFTGKWEPGRAEWCHRDGCTVVDVIVGSEDPDAYNRYIEAIKQDGWKVTDMGEGVKATSSDGLITMSILGEDDDLAQHLRSLSGPTDYIVFVSQWRYVFRSDLED